MDAFVALTRICWVLWYCRTWLYISATCAKQTTMWVCGMGEHGSASSAFSGRLVSLMDSKLSS